MKLLNVDLDTLLPTIKSRSIDLIILYPPYFKVVAEKWDHQWKTIDDYLLWFEKILVELERVSKYSATCWLFGFPQQLHYLLPRFEKVGFVFRQMITIDKGLRSVAGRTSSKLKMFPTATEYVISFYKDSKPLLRKMLQERKKESGLTSKDINQALGRAINGGGTWSSIAGLNKKDLEYPTLEVWNKLSLLFKSPLPDYNDYVYKFNQETGLTDVWRDINFYDKTYPKIHPTQKPYNLIERLIKCSSNSGDIVLDIFSGSGMSAKVCKDLGRDFIGCEVDKKYFDKSLEFIDMNL